MHVITILTVFASSVLATKNLVQVDIPWVGSDSVPGVDLSKRMITDPHPFEFDYASKTPDEMRAFVLDQCQKKAECTSTGMWGKLEKKEDKKPKFWEGSMYSGRPTTKDDYVQETTGTVQFAEFYTVQGSKKNKAHKAH